MARDGLWRFPLAAVVALLPLGAAAEWPGPLNGAAAAFDTEAGELVLFGGVASSGNAESLAHTWRWDGERWRRLEGPGPSGRSWPSLTRDPVTGALVLFGGKRDNTTEGTFGDTWLLRGEVWTPAETTDAPGARAHHAAAWDSTAQRPVLFGGQGPDGALDDAWAWSEGHWRPLGNVSAASARGAHAMYDDPTLGGVVIHGGSANPWPPLNLSDRWLVVRGEFRPLSPAPARALHVAARLPAGVLVYGGWGFEASTVAAPWLETGVGWQRLDDDVAPPPRSGAAWALDPDDGTLYLYGGADPEFEPLDDFWRFYGENWLEIPRASENVAKATDG